LAVIDPAYRGNDFALGIVHASPDGKIIVDRIEHWTGTKSAPLGFERVLGDVKGILGQYAINSVIGDQHCFDAIEQHLLKIGIYYGHYPFSANTRPSIFGNLKHLLVQKKIELLDDPDLLRQLRNLREEKTPRGQIDVRPFGEARDDIAVTIAIAASELTKQLARPTPFEPEGVPSQIARLPYMNPQDCYCAAVCGNFPECMDEDACKGFLSNGLYTIRQSSEVQS
jgi:hypothetical protein